MTSIDVLVDTMPTGFKARIQPVNSDNSINKTFRAVVEYGGAPLVVVDAFRDGSLFVVDALFDVASAAEQRFARVHAVKELMHYAAERGLRFMVRGARNTPAMQVCTSTPDYAHAVVHHDVPAFEAGLVACTDGNWYSPA